MGTPRETLSHGLLAAGSLLLAVAALAAVIERSFFDSAVFGRRAADSLSDEGVSLYAASQISTAIQRANPDLIAARPLIVASVQSAIGSRPFRSLVENAAARAHSALFSDTARDLVLTLPDAEILLRSALEHTSPGLAAKIPPGVENVLAAGRGGRYASWLLRLWQSGKRLLWLEGILFFLAPALLAAGLWLAPHRRLAVLHCGLWLCAVGLLLLAVPAGGSVLARGLIDEPDVLGLAQGLWRTYLGETASWGWFLAGFGVLLAAGATSLLEVLNPVGAVRRALLFLVEPPQRAGIRLAWAALLTIAGVFTVIYPTAMLKALAVVVGTSGAYIGVRELFRFSIERLDRVKAVEAVSAQLRWKLHVAVVVILGALLAGTWFWWRRPGPLPVLVGPMQCNGLPELCSRRLDEVVFPATHNSMSNQDIADWLFPHHEHNIRRQLEDGIRALLLDVHYGLPGGSRIKTDLSGGQNRERLLQVLGREGFEAAMRIRSRLVGVREERRDLYLCHGLCELGAYELAPALRSIHEFLVHNPDEVLLLIVEDYVSPSDLAAAFERSGLASLAYRGEFRGEWPTLREMIESRQRVVVFIESGQKGVPWIRPAFEHIQETRYTFRNKEDFSCEPNRGGTTGTLFLMNHWIETTPTPKPSNAAVVNAHEFLLNRAVQCAEERGRRPNFLAVDFYATGDVVGVARELNGGAALATER